MSEKVTGKLKELIETTFQLDRLERLCQGNLFLKNAYAELIGNINYCIVHEPVPGVWPGLGPAIVVGDIRYPFTLQGRKAAIAESFRHFSNKLDDFLSAANVAAILTSMDFVGDIAVAALRGSKVTQTVKP